VSKDGKIHIACTKSCFLNECTLAIRK